MPVTTGRYASLDQPLSLRHRWGWLRHNTAMWLRARRLDPRDNGGGYTMRREWGAWTLRPVTGWRSIPWVTPPVHATRSVPATERDAALDWHAEQLGIPH
ncbi:hypothetical protein [Nocardia exalbida]|uniref:hypothetical protein n=1 Tax=Nocardia exalbida TaxID=290231 RepID=UPI0012F6C723|nr:hypothetical protein [Nocardia exalbida]